ncbi:MAG TPA: hypothetical protein VL337_02925 [Acidimicrobiales bacterium]|nr:hypothetical protein [Acidimicrobiales bacterium]
MSPSDPPPEVLAIAVALAVLWPEASLELDPATREPSPWRTGGRRWERVTSHRWS